MSTVIYTDIKPKKHYEILDGLRGVAAILVVIFHIFETFSGGNRFIQIINHGYLAVDFFFLLSGFVVAYAYDDRWGKMTQWEFYKRRLIRLQPMVIMGMIIGAIFYYFQASDILFPQIAGMEVWKVILTMFIGFTLLPIPPSMEIRGWGEMHPLDGPAWSLFFEYIANILYALIFRRFSNKVLSVFVLIFAGLLINYTVFGPKGDVIGGWSLNLEQMNVGFTRLLYPFFAGVLLSRLGKLIHIKGAFWVCSILITIVLALPRFGDENTLWMNGLYESFVIILIFPIIVAIGAGGQIKSAFSAKTCKLLGDISYPIYITHYPLIYWYTAWVVNDKVSLEDGLIPGIALLAASIILAFVCLKLYDEPVRNWLQNKFQKRKIV
ncbi:Peptidoglycan/LPS O-acetylase OafA/YrhL, contains acyltransferase and SGNH-hydrolase domains [Flavobacterium sp. CF108]|uniref:acyltransferase family protein n=1 Tax=unclassified Flavobacterium TaxID=196869 RepID=UPI0008AE4DDC|nr:MULTISPECIES: acyltransferase [unclassified Flavobacterium]SEO13665.1 Peptidoglycan/LPS O-acetylase OafA/YrhL, contains acyltransferase and SGNH-hydrolase domains [Flavobacterium sp. fv08]SHG59042.1 Peptidoglycan/LPS O-acetylase OafA/YrhL, contains acyltransferase and SGNH-hydrolase domains [Flavobacterium sp. CF108]